MCGQRHLKISRLVPLVLLGYNKKQNRSEKAGGILKFLHIADVHWGARPDRDKPWGILREKEIKETFQKVLHYANEHHIDLLLISGDFFHQLPSFQEIREVDYLLSKLINTKTVWIAGNHDHLTEKNPLVDFSFQSDTIVFTGSSMEKIYFKDLDTTVYGLSYWTDQITEPLYDDVHPTEKDGIRILLAHGGDQTHIPISQEKLKWSGFDYIALGHIHKPEIIFEDLMAYAGSLEPIEKTETGRHGFIEGEITEEKQIVSFIPFAKRRYVDLEINISEDMSGEEILDLIRSEISCYGEDNIYHILLSGSKDPNVRPDVERLMEEYYILEIEYQVDSPWDYEVLSKEDDLLIQNVADLLKDEPEALKYAMEALSVSRED